MGMAASQIRLLALTSRLHDVEYRAQNIEAQKLALATQKDELYQNYCDALEAKKIQVKFNNGSTWQYMDATFNTLCGFEKDRTTNYALIDSKTGKAIVQSDVADAWSTCSNDKYAFAWVAMGMEGQMYWSEEFAATEIGVGMQNNGQGIAMCEVEERVYNDHTDDTKLVSLKEKYDELSMSDEATNTEKQAALDAFRDALYGNPKYRAEIYEVVRLSKEAGVDCTEVDPNFPEDFPLDEFNYYLQLYEKIKDCNGCITIDEQYQSGEEGQEWLNNMVTSGRVTIEYWNSSKKEWSPTSVATSTSGNNLQEVADDKDLKKAEAEYEYELGKINKKDAKFDRDLSKLETERKAITTEMDSVKKVKDDNVERTFGIFS